ncbi:MAG: hypothetical protein EHM21_06750 [Chloroflexi bacterium]|nr:MAG: hypothetical protein EHM21_06750 [Chloroflexota bacterium]
MDGNTIPVNESTTIIVKSSGDLFLRGQDQAVVRFQGSEDRIRINQSNDTLYVETRASLDLEVPRQAKLIVEKVGGSAFMQDIGGSLVVQKVGGDLSLQRIGELRIEKVGGGCMIDGVSETLNIGKVGGDLIVRQAAGSVIVDNVGGDTNVQTTGGDVVEGRTGGDWILYITEGVREKMALRAGGDVTIYLPANTSGRFSLNSGSEEIMLDFTRQEGTQSQTIESRNFEFNLGEGGPRVEAHSGGDIHLSDAAVEPELISGELERLENAWTDARGRYGSPSWSAGFGFDRSSAWADMVSRRAQEAARRAEQRVQAASRRTEDQIRQAAEREMRRAERSGGFPMTPSPPPPAASRSAPVSEKERLMVLQMLQEGKISVEQAEQLLAALEGRFSGKE